MVSYDEKPGIQAIATPAPDLPPVPGRHVALARDHEYKRHGTVSLLHAAYPAEIAINLILENHSARMSKETKAWRANQPVGRFEFTFTQARLLAQPHGRLLLHARPPALCYICVVSKRELKTASWPPWITLIATPSERGGFHGLG